MIIDIWCQSLFLEEQKKCTIVRYTPQDRKFGKTHYNAVLKIFPGFFEVMILILKVKLGYYDKRI